MSIACCENISFVQETSSYLSYSKEGVSGTKLSVVADFIKDSDQILTCRHPKDTALKLTNIEELNAKRE